MYKILLRRLLLALSLLAAAPWAQALVFAVNEGVTYRVSNDEIRARYAAIRDSASNSRRSGVLCIGLPRTKVRDDRRDLSTGCNMLLPRPRSPAPGLKSCWTPSLRRHVDASAHGARSEKKTKDSVN